MFLGLHMGPARMGAQANRELAHVYVPAHFMHCNRTDSRGACVPQVLL